MLRNAQEGKGAHGDPIMNSEVCQNRTYERRDSGRLRHATLQGVTRQTTDSKEPIEERRTTSDSEPDAGIR